MFKKRFQTAVILIVGSLLVFSLSRNIYQLLRSEKKVEEAQKELERLREEQKTLLEKEAYFGSEEFIEEQARNKLNMAKEGEIVVILPPNIEKVLGGEQPKTTQELPNWQKWLEVFGF